MFHHFLGFLGTLLYSPEELISSKQKAEMPVLKTHSEMASPVSLRQRPENTSGTMPGAPQMKAINH